MTYNIYVVFFIYTFYLRSTIPSPNNMNMQTTRTFITKMTFILVITLTSLFCANCNKTGVNPDKTSSTVTIPSVGVFVIKVETNNGDGTFTNVPLLGTCDQAKICGFGTDGVFKITSACLNGTGNWTLNGAALHATLPGMTAGSTDTIYDGTVDNASSTGFRLTGIAQRVTFTTQY
jgi:hypothetical protein